MRKDFRSHVVGCENNGFYILFLHAEVGVILSNFF